MNEQKKFGEKSCKFEGNEIQHFSSELSSPKRVEVEYGETVNAGNYESIRVACRIEGSFETEEELEKEQRQLYITSKNFVRRKVLRELKMRNE